MGIVGRVLVLSVCSLKGGVGKTSVTLGLASAAMARGVSTLVVDLDPQGDATTGLDVAHQAVNVSDAIRNPKKKILDEATVPSGWSNGRTGVIDVLTGGASVAELDAPDLDGRQVARLGAALGKTSGHDLVLIDCPPSLNGLTMMGWAASHRALVVTEPSLFAVSAADRALRAIDALRRTYAPQLQPLGIVVNRVRPRSAEHEYRLKELQELFGPLVLSPHFQDRAALQQAQGAARPIHTWPTTQARELTQSFDQLLGRVLRSQQA